MYNTHQTRSGNGTKKNLFVVRTFCCGLPGTAADGFLYRRFTCAMTGTAL